MRVECDLKGRYHKLLRAHPAAILQHGGRQDSARHLCHLVAHAELKLLDKWVGLVVCAPHLRDRRLPLEAGQKKRQTLQPLGVATHQPADLFLPVWRRAGGGFDHG